MSIPKAQGRLYKATPSSSGTTGPLNLLLQVPTPPLTLNFLSFGCQGKSSLEILLRSFPCAGTSEASCRGPDLQPLGPVRASQEEPRQKAQGSAFSGTQERKENLLPFADWGHLSAVRDQALSTTSKAHAKPQAPLIVPQIVFEWPSLS